MKNYKQQQNMVNGRVYIKNNIHTFNAKYKISDRL